MIGDIKNCMICPRNCGIDRRIQKGVCGASDMMNISKIMLHHWEEPCISGGEKGKGSGAIFFSGCNLKCIFCQNKEISRNMTGKEYSSFELSKEIRCLEENQALNINFVTPTHYYPMITETLDIYRPSIPIVFNTSGYEKADTIYSLKDYADIYLTDFKYGNNELAKLYSNAGDYVERSLEALNAMIETVGAPQFDDSGIMKKGVIVRHLVLPGERKDSIRILEILNENIDIKKIKLSLMSQYTPDYAPKEDKKLSRKVTSFEYDSVLDVALKLGYDGFSQEKNSAKKEYTPDF